MENRVEQLFPSLQRRYEFSRAAAHTAVLTLFPCTQVVLTVDSKEAASVAKHSKTAPAPFPIPQEQRRAGQAESNTKASTVDLNKYLGK